VTAGPLVRLRVAGVALAVIAASVLPSAASAARPIPGGRYVPVQFVPGTLDVALQVTRDGRALTSVGGTYGGSSFTVYANCVESNGTIGFNDDAFGTSLGAPDGKRVRIRSNGRISVAIGIGSSWGQHGGLHVSVRFPTRNRARISVSGGWWEPDSDNVPCHAHVRRVVDLRVHRPPPFAGCRRQSGTIIRGSMGQVYRQDDVTDFGTHTSFDFGCLNAVNRPIRLDIDGVDDDDNHITLKDLVLAGPYVAYVVQPCGLDCTFVPAVVDLRTGRARTHYVSTTYYTTADHSNLNVDAIALNDHGSIAWISQWCELWSPPGGCPPGQLTVEVWAMDRSGARLLDRGHGIDTQSLQLAGSEVTWRDDGVTQTAAVS
jgi:hypothetical protein